jgi:hypothetical protein
MSYALIPLIAIIVIGFPVALLMSAATKRRAAKVSDFAAQDGWHEPVAGAGLPEPVEAASHSDRSQLTFGKQLGPHQVWMNWHHWTETSSSPQSDGGQSTTSRVYNLTRYFASLEPGRYPDISFKRRTGRTAVRRGADGQETGDATFDLAFIVTSDDEGRAGQLLTAELRQAMLTKAIPLWSIQQGTLASAYNDKPNTANLDSRADTLITIREMLR